MYRSLLSEKIFLIDIFAGWVILGWWVDSIFTHKAPRFEQILNRAPFSSTASGLSFGGYLSGNDKVCFVDMLLECADFYV